MEADGWPLERLDASTWRTGFAADGTSYRLFVKTTASWLVLTIVPFVRWPEDDAQSHRTFRRMLELNREINLAKLAVDGRDVILTVELTLEGIDWPHLKDGIDAITYYAGTLHAELSAMTTTATAIPVREDAAMAEALSLAGDRHPGEIVFEDKVEDRTYSKRAADMPVLIAWVKLEATWVPVVKILITGVGQVREITNFGPNGQFLSGEFARFVPCAVCMGNGVLARAKRTKEGVESDQYRCRKWHRFGLDWRIGPATERQWPVSDEIRDAVAEPRHGLR